ncbi:MAG: di-trans,poly-cis-decaprenylcistransferase [Holosporales bacterium]|jgi:undecaprenyl diphosphate synthase|nr:di-trans,poly-cis-decaprenylcistransferase [Holosporales bacterium]
MSTYNQRNETSNPAIEHIAFIMDGNATWARMNGKNVMEGYEAGMRNMSSIILSANGLGLSYITFYVFSSENWGRPAGWIEDFMSLAVRFLRGNEAIRSVLDIGPKIRVIGDKTKLSREILEILSKYEEETRNNTGMTICLAISYGGRDEIVRAAEKVSASGLKFTEKNLSDHLDTTGIPDPQMIIRTGGHHRLSNFLLWQSHYSELYFTDTLWPDFGETELNEIITRFTSIERNHGK